MATDPGERASRDRASLAADERADYDYRGGPVERPDLLADLRERVAGDVRFDAYTRQLYATDASLYEVTPVGVVFPTSTGDVAAVVSYCAEREIPVLPRGGGTSLAGQAVNEAVVLDFTRHMDAVVEVDPDARRARAQPGVVLGRLNDELADHGLKFAPDPAWGDKSALGGAVGNNSTGAHSLRYGKTDAYVEACEVVLADGTVTTFEDVTVAELRKRADPDGDPEARIYAEVDRILDEHGDEIEDRYPDLKRNVSGYNLDFVVDAVRGERDDAERATGTHRAEDVEPPESAPAGEGGVVPMASLLCGSEGTLAVVTEVEVSLEPVPETKAVALLTYESLGEAVRDVAAVLEHAPDAVELVDDVLVDLAADTAEFADVVAVLPEGTRAVLLVEFYAETDEAGRRTVADLLADRAPDVEPSVDPGEGHVEADAPTRAFAALEAHDAATRERFWKLRKSGLPILLSRTTDDKHVSFIEDCAVPPEHMAEYVEGFREILDDHGTYASFYAHAGPGVLHVRPLVNTKTVEGVETMESIAEAVTDLVVELGGSVSGEHGDGRARTQWNRKLYGDELWGVFRDLKTAFDPDWLLNPGQVVGYDADELGGSVPERARTARLTENHRFGPDYAFEAGFEPELHWRNDDGMQGMVELCHGCGGCRGFQETTGGVMCPTFRASREEITSTRGRANALRQAMSGDLPAAAAAATTEGGDSPTEGVDPYGEEFLDEVLDLCIGCKGCARDCPSEVDLAKLKVEVTHARHQRHGASPRERLFADVDRLARLGSATAPVSNWLARLPGADLLAEKALGIARERDLPTFHRETFRDRFAARGPRVPADEAERRVLLFPDTFTNFVDPELGMAAVRVLEAAGVHVAVPALTDSGRPAYSLGFLDRARETARENVDALSPSLREDWDLVFVEPSDAVMVQSDYLDLLDGEDARMTAANAYGLCEYLDRFDLDAAVDFAGEGRLTYHGHCHQKATRRDHHAVGVLRRAGYEVEVLDSGCCGMAGSFGYEAEHYAMSEAIGEILDEQVDAADGAVVAPGTSCRTQLSDLGERPTHPVAALVAGLEG